MEPTAADVAAVSQHLGAQQPAPQPQATPAPQPVQPAPAPVEAPAFTPGVATPAPQPQYQPQQQPAEPTPQPAPTSQAQDPFSTLFTQPEPQPVQPTEPNPQPAPQPVEPQPTPQAQPQPQQPVNEEPQYQSFEEYMDSITGGAAQTAELPDASKIDPTDEEGIKNFFDELVNTAVTRARQENERSAAIQNSERQLWDGAFDKYASLRSNKNLRDMVHAIRMGEFKKGIAITPTQAADRLLDALKSQYKQGVADNQVATSIESVQPNGGGSTPVQTTTDMNNVYQQVQVGGEVALADYLDSQIKAGKL